MLAVHCDKVTIEYDTNQIKFCSAKTHDAIISIALSRLVCVFFFVSILSVVILNR